MIEFYHKITGGLIDNPIILDQLLVDCTGSVLHNRRTGFSSGDDHQYSLREDLAWRVTSNYHSVRLTEDLRRFMTATGYSRSDLLKTLKQLEDREC